MVKAKPSIRTFQLSVKGHVILLLDLINEPVLDSLNISNFAVYNGTLSLFNNIFSMSSNSSNVCSVFKVLGRTINSLVVVVEAVVVALNGLPATVMLSVPLTLDVAGVMSVS